MLDINWTLPVALVSVIVFLVLMNKILFKPLIQFMDARDKGIRDNLEEAARLRQIVALGIERIVVVPGSLDVDSALNERTAELVAREVRPLLERG